MADYLKFWAVSAPVFVQPLETYELFIPQRLQPVMERLKIFCEQQHCLTAIIGEAGSGKSTMARWLHDNLNHETYDVLLLSMIRKEFEPGWLTPRLAEFMGANWSPDQDLGQLIRRVAGRMDELIDEGRKLVVIIDAAHMAESPAAFDELIAFANLQSLAGSCLSFVLAGNKKLEDMIQSIGELKTRMAHCLELPSLHQAEVSDYLNHRLKLRGLGSVFSEEASDIIHKHAGGVYAHINVLAENCLIEAYYQDRRLIDADLARLANKLNMPPRHHTNHYTMTEFEAEPEEEAPQASAEIQLPTFDLEKPLEEPEVPLPVLPQNHAPSSDMLSLEPSAHEAALTKSSIKLSSLFKTEPVRSESKVEERPTKDVLKKTS